MRGALLAVCFVLSACGGGGDDASQEAPATPTPVVTAPSADPAPDGVNAPAGNPPPVVAREIPIAVAHRGLPTAAPEDTIASYRAAVNAGAKWVETDVRITRDGALVLMHDDSLARTTDAAVKFPGRAPWNVVDFTLAEIEQLDAGGWYSASFTGERVPTLGALLDLLKPTGTGLYLEIKSGASTMKKVAAELEAHGWVTAGAATQPLCVLAFNAGVLKEYRALHAGVPTSMLLSAAPTEQQLADYEPFADGISIPWSAIDAPILSTSTSKLLKRLGVYVVNGEANTKKALTYPFFALTTDNIGALQQTLDGLVK